MSDLYRFNVDYIDEEQGIKHIPSDHGDYVLAEDALKLQEQVAAGKGNNISLAQCHERSREKDKHIEELEAALKKVRGHSSPGQVCWRIANIALKQEEKT